VRSPATLAKAIVFGFGAAVVGAIIYYVVMRYLNLEIGLVAILTGWMVGKAMSKATAGRGGLLLQISAGLLTYASVAMAYAPFAFLQLGSSGDEAVSGAVADSTGTERPADASSASVLRDSARATAARQPDSIADAPVDNRSTDVEPRTSVAPNPLRALALAAGFVFILPLIVIVDSLPGGLISAAIIGFGMMQAWQLTRAPKLAFEGPFRLSRKEGDADRHGERPPS
jgi:hypothetical protein